MDYPKSLDYFYIEPFPELISAYGEKPNKLFIVFPADNIEEFYQTEYNLWASKGGSHVKKRSCDGEECMHHVAEDLAGQRYAAGEISPCLCMDTEVSLEKKELCKSYTGLKAYILHPNTGKIISPTCYLFETHSDNSSDNIYTEIDKVWHMTGGIITKIPFILSVQMVETTVAENGKAEKRKFPIWYLQAYGTTEMIIAFANRKTLPTTDDTRIEIADPEDIPALEAPKEEAPEPMPEYEALSQEPETIGDGHVAPHELKKLRDMLMAHIKSTEVGEFCKQYGVPTLSTTEITKEIYQEMVLDIEAGDPWAKTSKQTEMGV